MRARSHSLPASHLCFCMVLSMSKTPATYAVEYNGKVNMEPVEPEDEQPAQDLWTFECSQML